MWAMGRNYAGGLGDGAYNNTNWPEMIVQSNVTAIAGGAAHSLFLKSDGSLWATGYNYFGDLGDGSFNQTNNPQLILTNGVVKITCGSDHSLFIKKDGSLWGMGKNGEGELGDGTYSTGPNYGTNQPEQIAFNPLYNLISGKLLSAGHVQLSFVGITGNNYALDAAGNLSTPDWRPMATNTAGTLGALIFTNTPDPTTNNFWRIRSVP